VVLRQFVVHLVEPIGGERRCSTPGLGRSSLSLAPFAAEWGSHYLDPSLSGGEVHHQDPLHLEHGLMPRWCMRMDRGSCLPTSKLSLLWHCLLLGGGLLSTGLRLLPPNECGVAQKGGQYPAAAPPSMVEPSSWPEWPECSPSMVWL
jgi:hypothetical protein